MKEYSLYKLEKQLKSLTELKYNKEKSNNLDIISDGYKITPPKHNYIKMPNYTGGRIPQKFLFHSFGN